MPFRTRHSRVMPTRRERPTRCPVGRGTAGGAPLHSRLPGRAILVRRLVTLRPIPVAVAVRPIGVRGLGRKCINEGSRGVVPRVGQTQARKTRKGVTGFGAWCGTWCNLSRLWGISTRSRLAVRYEHKPNDWNAMNRSTKKTTSFYHLGRQHSAVI